MSLYSFHIQDFCEVQLQLLVICFVFSILPSGVSETLQRVLPRDVLLQVIKSIIEANIIFNICFKLHGRFYSLHNTNR